MTRGNGAFKNADRHCINFYVLINIAKEIMYVLLEKLFFAENIHFLI